MNNRYEDILASEGVLCTTNVGISMLPLLREGRDIMVIRPVTGALQRFDAVLFRRPGVTGRGAYVMHRILEIMPDGTYWIVGDNCIGGELVCRENILGILTDVRRKGRSIMGSSLRYRLYMALWVRPYRIRIFILKYKSMPRRIAGKLLRLLHLR